MKYIYVQEELEAAINFISENGLFDKTTVYNSIMTIMKMHRDHPGRTFIGTMGYVLKFNDEGEGIVMMEILVNPALGSGSSRKYITMEGDTIVDVEYIE